MFRLLGAEGKAKHADPLDAFKYVCKDLWTFLFGKPIDNLKTNHRGTFVMVDTDFCWIRAFGPDAADEGTAELAILVSCFGREGLVSMCCSIWHFRVDC